MTGVPTQGWLDQEDRHVAAVIREHGCFIQYVHGCRCGHYDEET